MRFLDALDGLGGWGDGDGYGTADDTRAISRDGLVPSRVQTARYVQRGRPRALRVR